jgi:hypothetical protein
VTGHHAGSTDPKSLADPAANIEASAGVGASDRNDYNDYAVYWQERSGFFKPIPDPDHNRHRPDHE